MLLLLLLLQDPGLARYITVKPGTLPVILSAPHGGTLNFSRIPERKGGEDIAQYTTVRDINTDLLAEKLSETLARKWNGQPFLVVAKFSRKWIDANRPAKGAYESDATKPVYDAYHAALEKACRDVKSRWGRGLLIDIHGQAARADAIFRGTLNGKSTTLLTQRFGIKAITGPNGFQGLLEAKGYNVLPPAASQDRETKFTGGFIVQNYGSHTGYAIDAIQLEFGGQYSARAKLDKTTDDLAEVITQFAKSYILEPK